MVIGLRLPLSVSLPRQDPSSFSGGRPSTVAGAAGSTTPATGALTVAGTRRATARSASRVGGFASAINALGTPDRDAAPRGVVEVGEDLSFRGEGRGVLGLLAAEQEQDEVAGHRLPPRGQADRGHSGRP